MLAVSNLTSLFCNAAKFTEYVALLLISHFPLISYTCEIPLSQFIISVFNMYCSVDHIVNFDSPEKKDGLVILDLKTSEILVTFQEPRACEPFYRFVNLSELGRRHKIQYMIR